MAKRFVGHCSHNEGTQQNYHSVMSKLYCTLDKCPPNKRNCYCCEHVISEVITL